MSKAVIGIGTNLGDRYGNMKDAVKALSLLPDTQVLAVSSVYETAPVGYADQPAFYNAACTDYSVTP